MSKSLKEAPLALVKLVKQLEISSVLGSSIIIGKCSHITEEVDLVGASKGAVSDAVPELVDIGCQGVATAGIVDGVEVEFEDDIDPRDLHSIKVIRILHRFRIH